MSAAHDPRKSMLVNGSAYRAALAAQRRKQDADDRDEMLTDIIAGIAMFTFLAGAGFLLMGLAS